MKNLKIGAKLLVTFAIVFALTLALAITSVIGLKQMSGEFTTFYNGPFVVTTQTANMRRAINGAERDILRSCVTVIASEKQEAIDNSTALMDELKNGVVVLQNQFTGDKKLVDDFFDYMNSTIDTKEKLFSLTLANKNDEAIELYDNEYRPMMEKARTQLEAIEAAANTNAKKFYEAGLRTEIIVFVMLLVFSVISLIAIIFFCIYLTKLLSRPIIELESAAEQIAKGDYNVELTYESKDELGSLSQSMRSMIHVTEAIITDTSRGLKEVAAGNFDIAPKEEYVGIFSNIEEAMKSILIQLSDTMRQINQSSQQVANGSEQVSSGAQALSQGATQQASSVQELAATINEISEQVRQNAANAQDARGKSTVTANEISESNQKMQEMIAAMNVISEKSGEISKIIKTIDDIAFQTNILALNAAVEAARAGAAGKGFAVVADEVRNLSGKSAEAAKNTTTLIEETVRAVENGVAIADETAHSMLAVVEGTHQVTQLVEEIAQASGDQAASINQVTQGVEQISAVVQTNSATAEESAAASEELSSQASILKDLVSKFRLPPDGGQSGSYTVDSYIEQPSVEYFGDDKY